MKGSQFTGKFTLNTTMAFPLIALLVFGYFASTTTGKHHNDLRQGIFQICGNRLSEFVSMLCNGLYALGKRSPSPVHVMEGVDFQEDAMEMDSPDNYLEMSYPFKMKKSSLSLIPNKFRRDGGIANECCIKPCSIDELKSYCY